MATELPFPTTPFQAGCLKDCLPFWREEILRDAPEDTRRRLLSVVENGVDVHDYFGVMDTDARSGEPVWRKTGPPPPSQAVNRVPAEFHGFVNEKIQAALLSGALKRVEERPHTVLAVSIEPEKPRLITDARPINKFTQHVPFEMRGVQVVPDLCPPGTGMSSVDHENGYHHVALTESSYQYFGMFWEGIYYVWTVLVFGYSLSPFFYHSLSEAVCAYVRRASVPATAWIDDFLAFGRVLREHMTMFDSHEERLAFAAARAAFILTATNILAGYRVSLRKSVLFPVTTIRFLGFILDSVLQHFFIPADKRDKFLAMVETALEHGTITFKRLEKLHGKATAFLAAVPSAKMFTRAMQHVLTQTLRLHPSARQEDRKVGFKKDSQVAMDLREWLRLREDLNGGPWLASQHMSWRLQWRVESDASSKGWGAALFLPATDGVLGDVVFEAASEFSMEESTFHINRKEMLAVCKLVRAFAHAKGHDSLRGRRLSFWLDNVAAVANFTKWGGSSVVLTACAREWFWLQMELGFTATFKWWGTKANWRADLLSRLDVAELWALPIRLQLQLLRWLATLQLEVVVDIMASPVSAILDVSGQRLPFISRYHTGEEIAVDVMAVNPATVVAGQHHGEGKRALAYCFPPGVMRLAVLSHLATTRTPTVWIAPARTGVWSPLVLAARTHVLQLALTPAEQQVWEQASGGEQVETEWEASVLMFF